LSHDVERFNRWAATYDRHYLQRLVFEPVQGVILDLAVSQVPSPAAILDVGCGTGRLLMAAEQRFPNARLEGVDSAIEMVKHAQAVQPAGSRINFRQATAEHLPFPDAQFDLAFSTMTFHHWSDQPKGIAEVARVLKPGGRWLLADFIATGPMRWVFMVMRPKRFHERAQIASMLAPAGLVIAKHVAVRGLGGQVSVLSIGRAIRS
jgi:ubiquinone/menaquinone biosynthesis C-methylase UbiE